MLCRSTDRIPVPIYRRLRMQPESLRDCSPHSQTSHKENVFIPGQELQTPRRPSLGRERPHRRVPAAEPDLWWHAWARAEATQANSCGVHQVAHEYTCLTATLRWSLGF